MRVMPVDIPVDLLQISEFALTACTIWTQGDVTMTSLWYAVPSTEPFLYMHTPLPHFSPHMHELHMPATTSSTVKEAHSRVPRMLFQTYSVAGVHTVCLVL